MVDDPRLSAGNPPVNKAFAFNVYLLYFIAIFTAMPMFIGVIVAYAARNRETPWLDSHFRYQIRTFWIMWVYLSVALLLFIPLALLGVAAFGLVAIWVGLRCGFGVYALSQNRAVERPGTWLF